MKNFLRASIACILAGAATMAVAQTAPGMSDLLGARGSSLDYAIGQKGYKFAVNKGAASMYWNHNQKRCVSVLVSNGRVDSIQTATAADCGKRGGILVNAIRDVEFNRGKNDAMGGRPYSSNDSEEYHSGYMEGERLRGGGHTGHGVSQQRVDDLNGSDSIAAIDKMSERGFASVDTIDEPNTQYGIFYNRATHQCVQLTMADGRVVGVNDIGHHPKCH